MTSKRYQLTNESGLCAAKLSAQRLITVPSPSALLNLVVHTPHHLVCASASQLDLLPFAFLSLSVLMIVTGDEHAVRQPAEQDK